MIQSFQTVLNTELGLALLEIDPVTGWKVPDYYNCQGMYRFHELFL